MKRICVCGIALTLSACVVQLTQAGSRVRRIQPDWATQCQFLGVVEGAFGNGASVSDDQLGAMNDLRNNVAAMGGNAYAITHGSSSVFQSVIQADAYRCPEG